MKKIVSAMLVLSLLAGCKPKPVVVEGVILGYEGQEVNASLSGSLSREKLEVAEDGTFHVEKMIDEAFTGGLSIVKGGSFYGLIIPGKHYHFDIDLTKTPAAWNCENDCQAEQAFYKYMVDTLLKIDFAKYVFPDRFADFDAMWAERMKEGERNMSMVRNRSALKYFKNTIALSVARSKVNFANQLAKKGLAPSDDADYMSFFNSIDLSDDTMSPMLSAMLQIKSDMYCDTLPASVRYIQAIDELAPSQEVKDSVTAKYLDSVIKDGKIASQFEGEFLLAQAERYVADEELLSGYRERVAKAMSLMPGCDAIDFNMTDAKGKTIRLSDLEGKVVYVDFWATWCIPCCLQIPFMKVLAAKYASNPEVACISVSFDSDLKSWKSMLDYDKPAWPQYVADGAGKQIMADYGFQAIPRFMVIGKDGKIVTVNAPRPQDIDAVTEIIESQL